MLTKEQAILNFDFSTMSVVPDRLSKKTHAEYVSLAEQVLRLYRDNVGQPRQLLHERVRRLMGDLDDCPTRRIAAFCKLLDDASEYEQDSGSKAAKLRSHVFNLAATRHPLVQSSDQLFDHSEADAKQEIADQLGRPWTEIEGELFNDVIEFHRLKTPPVDMDAARLLGRYNVAQTQATLYGATAMTVWASQDFKTVLRYAKLARLMHVIEQQGDQTVFRFNGPASIVRSTRRYGVAFAKFLPGLLAAKQWRMQATVIGPLNRRFALQLSSRDGLRSEIEPEAFDSELEEKFYRRWHEQDTDGWKLQREATILHEGQSVFMPDFTLSHPDHGQALLEIVGFWTPEYLQEKAKRLKQFQSHGRIVLAIADAANEAIPDLAMPRCTFKSSLRPKQVLDLLAM